MKKIAPVIAVLLSAALHAVAAVLPAEKLLPDDTLVLFAVPDFNKVREIYRNSPQGQFLSDPAMKPYNDKLTGKFQSEYLTPLEHDLGIHFTDYTNLLQGQFTLALVQNGWQGKDKDPNDPAYLLLLDTKDKSSQLKTNLADLKKKWVDAGKTARTEKIRDIDFSVIVLSTNDVPKSLKKKPVAAPNAPEPMEDPDAKNAPKKELYIGQAESLLIIGNSAKPIEKILAAMSGGNVRTLSDLPAYSSTASGMFHDAPLYGWINAKTLVDAFIHKNDGGTDNAPNPLGFDPAKLVTALGFGGLKTIAFSYTYAADGAQFNLAFGVPEAERTGLFKILAGEAKDYAPPAFVPADAVAFQRWRMDGQKIWNTIHKTLADISPSSVGGVDFMLGSAESAAKEKDPAFDLKKNFFGNLGDDIITYQKNAKDATNSAPSLVLVGSPNPDQLGNAIRNLLVLYQLPTEREFLGHKIYSVPMGGSGAKGEPSSHIEYTSAGGYIAISSDSAMIEEYLRSSAAQGKSLREISGLADAMQKVGGSGTSLFGYSNESETRRASFELMKKSPETANPLGDYAMLLASVGVSGEINFKDWADASLLPDFDKISKYFYFAVYAGAANPDGLQFKTFWPVPPGLKKESASPAPAPAPKPAAQ